MPFKNEQQAIENHLGDISYSDEFTFFSGFRAALRDARLFTKRNLDTGVKLVGDEFGDHGSWLGAIGYMTLLDQIGKCFKPKSATTINGNSIVKALLYFTDLKSAEVDALYALRCAFAHDYSLFNIHPSKSSLTHYFSVCKGSTLPVVKLPVCAWDGNYTHFTVLHATIVNLEALGDLVEDVYNSLTQLASTLDLEITLSNGVDELEARYSFYTGKRTEEDLPQ